MTKRAPHATPTEDAAQAEQAAAQATHAAAPATAAAERAAVVSATPAAPAPATAPPPAGPDEHHGCGGLYRIDNGRRVLVERSQRPDDETA